MKNILKTIYILTLACIIVFMVIFFTQDKVEYESNNSSGYSVTKPVRLSFSNDKKEQQCLEEAIWFEARGDGDQSMKAVANVILNRVSHKGYPSSICSVIDQPKQFSYRNHLKPSQRLKINPKPSEHSKYTQMKDMVNKWRTEGFEPILRHDTLWYAHFNVKNYWTKTKIKVQQVGSHVFYARTK